MKKIFNLFFIFTIALVFSPLKSTADCHPKSDKKDECHRCHDEASSDNDKGDQHHEEHSDCPMACCHVALVEAKVHIFNTEINSSFYVIPPWHTSGVINNYLSELLRPPIA